MKNNAQDSYINSEHPKEINLREYFEVIKRRFWIIILVTVLMTAAGYIYNYYSTLNSTSLYETSTRMIFGSEEEDMNTLMVMIEDPIIMENVKNELQLTRPVEAMQAQIEVTRLDESQVIQISVTDQDPETAANIANATAASFKSEIASILDYNAVQLLSEAKENPLPINAPPTISLSVIALAAGVILGVGLVFLLDSMDDKIRKEREVEEIMGVPVIGIVSNMNKKKYAFVESRKKKSKRRGEAVAINENAYNEQ
ncbi:YveK family protein [Lentibacillus sediminis]|uniref:YveK family protein n=1 Tax=Lentibacillus sediminis TaxID=1940529 RepID=UPI000C1B9CDB|nr:Wzz/FepE/Etk N-terminal domain-containing protein [Lentibacillus sediminis]